jgi:hypothetical protein
VENGWSAVELDALGLSAGCPGHRLDRLERHLQAKVLRRYTRLAAQVAQTLGEGLRVLIDISEHRLELGALDGERSRHSVFDANAHNRLSMTKGA